MNSKPKNVRYGIDAPGIMVALLAVGAALLTGAILLLHYFTALLLVLLAYVLVAVGAIVLLLGLAMLVYGWVGKYRTREAIMRRIAWKGNEMVLDVGTGQGMLMNAAALRLKSGKAVGIDIWSSKDLSDNSPETALRNAREEGVADKIQLITQDARSMSFADNTFDVVVSLLCIHNIEPKADQAKVCAEIARVLKPGGTVVIGDYIPTHTYARYFTEAGLEVISTRAQLSTALSLMWFVEARKP
jgi:arsenite methyltransferase